jgi:23S rRNA (pseudouridine1915-N3)-methyltransferase
MQLTVYSLGKIKNKNLENIRDYYRKLTESSPKTLKINLREVKDKKPDQVNDPEEILELYNLNKKTTYFLAEWGDEYSTEGLIKFIDQSYQRSEDITFVVGNAYGWSDESKQQKDLNFLSLSKLTMNHELAEVVLWEQLFRLVDRIQGGNYAK